MPVLLTNNIRKNRISNNRTAPVYRIGRQPKKKRAPRVIEKAFKDGDIIRRKTSSKNELLLACIGSWFLTALILLLVFVLLGFIPFGNAALLYKDGEQQMVDLFCWYKDVLSGKSSIDYTFTKYLGGSNFGVFSYYLASPFCLLAVFFDKTQMPLFINVLYVLKASFASSFACLYIFRRFN